MSTPTTQAAEITDTAQKPHTNTAPEALQQRAKAQRTRDRFQTTGLFVIFFLGFIGLWHLATVGLDDGGLAPTPGATWDRLLEMLGTAFLLDGPNNVGIFYHLLASIQRVLLGFGLAAIIAVPLGLLLGTSRVIHDGMDPFIQILRPVSPLAWLPLGLALLRDSQMTAIFVIFMAALWPILVSTIDGVRRVNPLFLDLAKSLETDTKTRVFKVLLPATLPAIVTGLRTALSTAWLVIVAAEMIVGGRGMGHFVWNEWNALNTPSIVVAIVIIGGVGFLLDRSIAQLQRLVPKS
ncbi:ABC transporter permease [Nesterenkonia sandarakina]|uniref:Nitrate/nitrite transport system permease protein n=1 Tax=Nesterenkonia sandarakina TaxID=272918 RepID=A0A2T0YR27_9MICC|nr:ABC transporter permease [Nesterenkonia sandarakina]PRZ17855.1 nitrate/nitrite transport system permease protein [Nesterenkonia sandarakina]